MKLSVRNTFLHATGEDDETPTVTVERQGQSRTAPAPYTIPDGAISDSEDEDEKPKDTSKPVPDDCQVAQSSREPTQQSTTNMTAQIGSAAADRSPVSERDHEKATVGPLPAALPKTNVATKNTFVHLADEEATLPAHHETRASTAPTAYNRASLGLDSDSSEDETPKPKEVPRAKDDTCKGTESQAVVSAVEMQAQMLEAQAREMQMKAQQLRDMGKDLEKKKDSKKVAAAPVAHSEEDTTDPSMMYPAQNPLMAGMIGMAPGMAFGMPPGMLACPGNDQGFAGVLAAQAAAQAAWAQVAQVNYAMAGMGATSQMMTPTFDLANYQQKSGKTTLVLRNLPLNYRRNMLLRMLDHEGFSGQYDFVYLPIDFKTAASLGYAFVNMVEPSMVDRFWSSFDGYNKWMFRSSKVCAVSWSTPHQGLKVHIDRFRNSPVMHESVPDEYKPVLFINGVRVAFPEPTKKIWAPSFEQAPKAAKGGGKKAKDAKAEA